jgi:hypothetical protein
MRSPKPPHDSSVLARQNTRSRVQFEVKDKVKDAGGTVAGGVPPLNLSLQPSPRHKAASVMPARMPAKCRHAPPEYFKVFLHWPPYTGRKNSVPTEGT